MNKKGQSFGIALMGAIMIFLVGLTTINFLADEVTSARTNLECSSAATISDGTKLLCLVIDTTVIYFMLILFSVSGGLVISSVMRR